MSQSSIQLVPHIVSLRPRENTEKLVREPRSSILSKQAVDVVTALWNSLEVPAFKSSTPLFTFDAGNKMHLMGADTMTRVMENRDKSIMITKGMVSEQKFIVAAINTFNGYSRDMQAMVRTGYREQDMKALWSRSPGMLIVMATDSGVIMAASRTDILDSCERNLLDVSGDLSFTKMLSLLTGDRLLSVDYDGEMIGLTLGS